MLKGLPATLLAGASLVGILVAVLILLSPEDAKAPPEPSAAALSVPSGFQDRKVVDAPGATALDFTKDGRLLVAGREGRVLVHEEGTPSTTEALNISAEVCSNSERGLLGIAVDPNFEANGYVYLYYTYKKYGVCPESQPERNDNPVNRVSRFTMEGGTILPTSEKVLVNNIPSPNGNHNGGDLHFGKDGKLYASTGDGSCDYAEVRNCQPENDASRDRNVLLGKILRVNPEDGSIPTDNPYAGASNGVRCGTLTNRDASGGSVAKPGSICQETFAMGFRNPFRFAMDPNATGTSFRINDVGGGRIEEIDQAKPGADYGWNCREGTLVLNTGGPCDPAPKITGPIHQYNHNSGCSSITGGAFVPDGAAWPASYENAYLFGDYVCGKIFKLEPKGGGGFEQVTFASGLRTQESGPGPVSMTFGPSGSGSDLYYTTYTGGGQVHRISPVVENKAPSANINKTPTDPETGATYGPTPLSVEFDGSGSTDPDPGNTLTYEWDFTSDGTVDARDAKVSHVYQTEGPHTATLTVKDGEGASDIAKATVYPGDTAPPEPVIESPAPSKTFVVGEEISLQGSATDVDDGSNVELKWEVIRHHTAPNAHTHPSILDLADSVGDSVMFRAPGPEDLLSTNPDGNYLEVRLTATDSQGLQKTVTRDLKPRTTEVSFATGPTGFRLYASGQTFKGPRTFLSWEGYGLNVYAPPQRQDGRDWVFKSWSDGRGARHTIVTPADPAGYKASFRRK